MNLLEIKASRDNLQKEIGDACVFAMQKIGYPIDINIGVENIRGHRWFVTKINPDGELLHFGYYYGCKRKDAYTDSVSLDSAIDILEKIYEYADMNGIEIR